MTEAESEYLAARGLYLAATERMTAAKAALAKELYAARPEGIADRRAFTLAKAAALDLSTTAITILGNHGIQQAEFTKS